MAVSMKSSDAHTFVLNFVDELIAEAREVKAQRNDQEYLEFLVAFGSKMLQYHIAASSFRLASSLLEKRKLQAYITSLKTS